MLGYVLAEDMFDEMIQNINFIKLNSYLEERKSQNLFLLFIFYGAKLTKRFIFWDILLVDVLVAVV